MINPKNITNTFFYPHIHDRINKGICSCWAYLAWLETNKTATLCSGFNPDQAVASHAMVKIDNLYLDSERCLVVINYDTCLVEDPDGSIRIAKGLIVQQTEEEYKQYWFGGSGFNQLDQIHEDYRNGKPFTKIGLKEFKNWTK